MTSELFEFVWQVPQEGYGWAEAKLLDPGGHPVEGAVPERVLTDGLALGSQYFYRQYDPLRSHGGLFRTFASLDPTEECILAFANQYGMLGEPRFLETTAPERPNRLQGIRGEPLLLWQGEIAEMRRAVRLRDLIRQGERKTLGQYIKWEQETPERGSGVFYEDPEPPAGALPSSPNWRSSAIIASPRFHPEWLERFPPGNTILPARVYLNRLVNEHLQGRASPRLLHDAKKDWSSVLRLVPHNLIGCLWLQLAETISANKEQRQCAGCQTWFEVGTGTRTDKTTCSAACRNRVYRKRQELAQQMSDEGKKPKEIAEALGLELATVKKWLSLKGR